MAVQKKSILSSNEDCKSLLPCFVCICIQGFRKAYKCNRSVFLQEKNMHLLPACLPEKKKEKKKRVLKTRSFRQL